MNELSSSGMGAFHRSWASRWASAFFVVGIGAASGCSSSASSPMAGEMAITLLTDLSVPKDIDSVSVKVAQEGGSLYSERRSWDSAGKPWNPTFVLPKGVAPAGVRLRVSAVGWHGARPMVLAERWVTLPPDQNRSLKLSLSLLCVGSRSFRQNEGAVESVCPPLQSCQGGQCVSALGEEGMGPSREVSAETLQAHGSGNCLPLASCFDGSLRVPFTWQGTSCVADVPKGNPPLRLAVVPSGSTLGACNTEGRCYVPLSEGTSPGQWQWVDGRAQLPPAVCDGVVEEVRASVRCPWEGSPLVCEEASSSSPSTPKGQGPAGAGGGGPSDGGRGETNASGGSLLDGGDEVLEATQCVPPWGTEGGAPATSQGQSRVVVAGSVEGLEREGLVLLLNRRESMPIPAGAKEFAFRSRVRVGTPIAIDFESLPDGTQCSVRSSAGSNPVAAEGIPFSVRCVSSPAIRQIVAGHGHTCALLAQGTVRCWGDEGSGQLGGASSGSSIPGLENVAVLSSSSNHTCAVLTNGRVRCWGEDLVGQLGESSPSVDVPGLPDAVGISAGVRHTCALLKDTTVRCWGLDGGSEDLGAGSSRTRSVPGLSGVTQVVTGFFHTCALRDDGTVRCWGGGPASACGPCSPTTSIPGLSGVKALVAGFDYTCGLLQDGTVRCWGPSRSAVARGQSYRTPVPGLQGVKVLAGGERHVCALGQDDRVRCWGDNEAGELGSVGSEGPDSEGMGDPGLSGVRLLAAGVAHTCAVSGEGSLHCWGENNQGQTQDSLVRPSVQGLTGIKEVVLGYSTGCALLGNSNVHCWGKPWLGQDGEPPMDPSVPILSQVVSIASSTGTHTCALLPDETVRCWGNDEDGQLGGSSPLRSVPGLSGVKVVGTGVNHTCVILADTTVRCWGFNEFGQTAGSSTTESIPGLSGAVQISAGGSHTCVRLATGQVRCWGAYIFGSDFDLDLANQVSEGLSGVSRLASGQDHTCAVMADSTVRCWGSNAHGETGGASYLEPMAGLSGVVDLRAGDAHTCALRRDQTITCWGNGGSGQTGRATPTRIVPFLGPQVALAAGGGASCALDCGGNLTCWGEDRFGQISGVPRSIRRVVLEP